MAADKGEWKSASWKQEEDHTKETTELLERVNADTISVLLRSTAKTLEQYIDDDILALEKKARFGGDTLSTQRLCVEAIRICRTQNKTDLMLKYLEQLLKKRGQMKQSQSAMIKEAGLAVEDCAKENREQLLSQLRFLTQGKIHVELEYARFSVDLCKLIVAEGRKREASDMLISVQVETITNMPRLEKIEVILQQIRLAIDLDDRNRTIVLSRKLNPRAIGKDDTKELKVRYFKLMLEHYEKVDGSALVVARCWHEIYLTLPEFTSVSEDSSSTTSLTRFEALENCIVNALLAPQQTVKEIDDIAEYCALSKQSNQTDRGLWLTQLLESKDVRTDLPMMERLLGAFTSVELIRMAYAADVEDLCSKHSQLAGNSKRLEEFLFRLSEHDILVIAKFYKRIPLARLASLVGLSLEKTEDFVMVMVQTKTVYAKIDRIDGVVVFEKARNPVDIAHEWNEGVEKLTTLVDRTCQLVAKERMIITTKA